jgi:hypothetical protein
MPVTTCALFKHYWRMSDIYALPITLRYKRQKYFYTNYGAIASNLVALLMVYFFYSYTQLMLDDSQLTTSYT